MPIWNFMITSPPCATCLIAVLYENARTQDKPESHCIARFDPELI